MAAALEEMEKNLDRLAMLKSKGHLDSPEYRAFRAAAMAESYHAMATVPVPPPFMNMASPVAAPTKRPLSTPFLEPVSRRDLPPSCTLQQLELLTGCRCEDTTHQRT